MNTKLLRALTLAALLVAGAALVSPAASGQSREPPMSRSEGEARGSYRDRLHEMPGDLRSLVVLRYECASELGRREVTLFGNGTVRLFDGPPEEEEMDLGELGPDALEGVLARIEGEDLSEAPAAYPDVEGDWVERCVLELPLRAGKGPSTFRFSGYSSLPLELSRVVSVAKELGEVAEGERGIGLPRDYEPSPGDVLRRKEDDARFRVVAFTIDGKGVELEGLDVPLTLYLPPDALGEVFVEVVSRRDEGW
jgi:hypothetical protein